VVTGTTSILDRILNVKFQELAAARSAHPLPDVCAQAADAPPPRDLAAALRRAPHAKPRVIAEVKRRSPSAGDIRPGAVAVEIAQQYMLAGAAAISVLTDERFFGGSLADLAAVRAGTRLPVLRKDFLVDPYDVWRARAAGADAVLLIVAALEPARLAEMTGLARELGMTALVEVHDEDELATALAAGATVVGVNHRDLRTFEIDMDLSARLRTLAPPEVVFVAESGIRGPADVARLQTAGADAILVGETLMRAPDPGQALRELIA
jgi:indole-3-glycerol phosphate synthase